MRRLKPMREELVKAAKGKVPRLGNMNRGLRNETVTKPSASVVKWQYGSEFDVSVSKQEGARFFATGASMLP